MSREEQNRFANETPDTDAEIVAAEDIGFLDDDVPSFGAVASCTKKSWTGWYKRRNSTYKICKDRDGYVVHKPGGGTDVWGSGYTWREVKSGYGLAGVRFYQSACRDRDCR